MSSPVFPQIPAITPAVSIAPGDTTTLKTLYTVPSTGAGSQGVLLGHLRACSSDTAAQTLQFVRTISSTDYIIGESQVPAGAGTNSTTVWKDLLSDLNLGNALALAPGEILKVKSKATVTTACKIDIVAEAAPLPLS